MTTNSLLSRVSKLEQRVSPDIIPIPPKELIPVKVGEYWEVKKLPYKTKKQADEVSARFKEFGLSAYLDELREQVLKNNDIERGNRNGCI